MHDQIVDDISAGSMPHAARLALYGARERLRFQARFVGQALCGLIACNGIGEIATVTMSLSRAFGAALRTGLWDASVCFAIGIVLALATYAAAFLSQGTYYRKFLLEIDQALGTHSGFSDDRASVARYVRHGRITENTALFTAITSLLALAIGSLIALSCLRPA